jgi:asparagine synthase (glutamine-hydrolysing)
MCGICGVVYADRDRIPPESLIDRMTAVLAHRGPDDRDLFREPGAGLGHQRLSIIDLSPAGRQPMANEDGSLLITYNGEIYNFRRLREDLLRRGHTFRSRTDTETILHLYEEMGTDCLRELRGMFAFAIWDRNRRRLFLARDRVGQKPLVWAEHDGGFYFASELKSILEVDGFPRDIDDVALHHYLTYEYVPSPQTIFTGIRKLPPGHHLLWENGEHRLTKYWDLPYEPKLRLGSLRDYQERFLEIFREAVSLRLVSDVPLGAFLSGGLDSSAVAAMMSLEGTGPVKTFSIGFSEEAYDEVRFARQVAQRYGTEHEEMVVEPRALEVLPKLLWHYGEPFADPSSVPTYYVSQLTRRHVTVALSGDGGDEAFAGYTRYLPDRRAAWFFRIPHPLRERVIRRIAEMRTLSSHPRGFFSRLHRFMSDFETSREREYVKRVAFFTNRHKEKLYTADFAASMGEIDSLGIIEDFYQSAMASNFLDRTLSVDVHTYLPDDILVKVDIASMANSLETRSPFLDHVLMEFAASCPADLKMRGTDGKYLVKRAMEPYLPRDIIYRAKMGFGMPVAEWFRAELKETAYDVLLSSRTLERGYFSREGVFALLDEHVNGGRDHAYRLWALLFLELWFREFIDGASSLRK